MLHPNFYTTPRTATYYTLGPDITEAKHLWFVCHGFGQLAGSFIQEFETIAQMDARVVGPEALNRFYTKGFDGRVGATWMTREHRETEIQDYVTYLDGLYQQETEGLLPITRRHLLGFSQGATSICRWVAMRAPAFNHLWLCSGDMPHDLDWRAFTQAMEGKKLHVVVGNNDPLIPPGRKESIQAKIEEHGLNYKLHEFDGAHELNLGILKSGML